jgi:hypothetical protein
MSVEYGSPIQNSPIRQGDDQSQILRIFQMELPLYPKKGKRLELDQEEIQRLYFVSLHFEWNHL